jgi:hypothetical protein
MLPVNYFFPFSSRELCRERKPVDIYIRNVNTVKKARKCGERSLIFLSRCFGRAMSQDACFRLRDALLPAADPAIDRVDFFRRP